MNKLFLVEERARLGLKAKDIADYTGVAIPTQSNYEQGKRYPDAASLMKLAELGFDINYVLTGRHDSLMLSPQERMLIDLFRQSSESVQRHILAGLLTNNTSGSQKSGNTVFVGESNSGNVAGNNLEVK